MLRKSAVLLGVVAAFSVLVSSNLYAECLKVADNGKAKINQAALNELASIGLTRERIFQAIHDVAMPETQGCWAGSIGDFDSAILSVGAAQWNFGQSTLQPLLRSYKESFKSLAEFKAAIDSLAPTTGQLLFSEGCLRRVIVKTAKGPSIEGITAECKQKIFALQKGHGRVDDKFKAELDALFESDAMIQVQVDYFVSLLSSVKDDLRRVFPKTIPTTKQIKWAIDVKVQQGFPYDPDIARIRKKLSGLSEEAKREEVLRLIQWYEALCKSVDQEGIKYDWDWNIRRWTEIAKAGKIDAEEMDLLHISFLRSRSANGDGGLWQANTFERRVKIILGVGSVGGRQDDIEVVAQ